MFLRPLLVIILLSILIFQIPYTYFSVDNEQIDADKSENNLLKEINNTIDKTVDLDTSLPDQSYLYNDLKRGILPDNFTGKVMVLSSEKLDLENQYLPPLDLGSRYLHFIIEDRTKLLRLYMENPLIDWINLDTKLPFFTEQQTSLYNVNLSSLTQYPYFQDTSNAQKVHDTYNITGDGVTIGITDSGVDFGHSDFAGSMKRLSNGYSASFDPTSTGLAVTSLTLNPFEQGGLTYLPTDGKSVEVWGGEYYQFINSTSLGIRLQNFEITDIDRPSLSGNYKFGIAYQPFFAQPQFHQVFFFILTDSTTPNIYDTLYVDMDTSLAVNLVLNDIIFESGRLFRELSDWSFSDETASGSFNPVLARDITGNGVNDISMGALASTLDAFGVLFPNTQNIYRGIHSSGAGIAYMYDPIGHGTQSAGAAAARGLVQYPLYDDLETTTIENGTTYYIPGSAPNAKIIATKGLSLNDFLLGWLWTAGLEPNFIQGTWTVNHEHRVDISSNSWGDSSHTSELKGSDFYSLFIDALSTPNIFAQIGSSIGISYANYPGKMFVVSMGNTGPGFGTVPTPGGASYALTVGASTSFHHIQQRSKNNVALFSSHGPSAMGYVKPDIVALGSFGFTPRPVLTGIGNGTYAFGEFGGTSEAAPRVAGITALLYEVFKENEIDTNIGTVRTLLKSTAIDIGFSSLSQGAGLADAYKAVTAVLTNDAVILQDFEGPKLIGQRLNPAFIAIFGASHPAINAPFPDAFIATTVTNVTEGIELNFTYPNGTSITGIDNLPVSRLMLTETIDRTISSVSDPRANINLNINQNDLFNVDLIQVSTVLSQESYNNLLRYGLSPPDIRLMDLSHNQVIAEYYSTGYGSVMYVGKPSTDFPSGMGLRLVDPGYQNNIGGWLGLDYNLTVRAFKHHEWDKLSVVYQDNQTKLIGSELRSDYAISYIKLNDTYLPVAFLEINDIKFGSEVQYIGTNVDTGTLYRLDEVYAAWNWLGQTARADSGEHRYYNIQVPNNATFLALRAEWNEDYMTPHFYLFNARGERIAMSNSIYMGGGYYIVDNSEPNAENIIIPTSGGRYTLQIHITQTPFTSAPYDLKVYGRYLTIPEIPTPVPKFSQDLNEVISGNLEIDASDYFVEQFPELYIDNTAVQVFQGSNQSENIIMSFSSLQVGPLTPEYELPLELKAGERIHVSLDWVNERLDLDMYLIHVDDEIKIENDLFNAQATSSTLKPETAYASIPKDGLYILYIDFVSGSRINNIEASVSINSILGPTLSESGSKITIPTDIFSNDEYGLKLTYHTNFGLEFIFTTIGVFENHQPFTANVLSPNSGSVISEDVEVFWETSKEVQTNIYLLQNDISIQLGQGVRNNNFTFDSTKFENGPAILIVSITDLVFKLDFEIQVTIENQIYSTLPEIVTETNDELIQFQTLPMLLMLTLLYFHRQKMKRRFFE
jgi:subtilisin family serine protease